MFIQILIAISSKEAFQMKYFYNEKSFYFEINPLKNKILIRCYYQVSIFFRDSLTITCFITTSFLMDKVTFLFGQMRSNEYQLFGIQFVFYSILKLDLWKCSLMGFSHQAKLCFNGLLWSK